MIATRLPREVVEAAGVDGRSIVPILKGGQQDGRDTLYTVFHKTAGKKIYEMRAIHDDQYYYIFNAWSDGKTVFRNESQAGRTMKAMRATAADNPAVAKRVKLFLYREPQELYDYKADPDALGNLAGDSSRNGRMKKLQGLMLKRMKALKDPLLDSFKKHLGK